MLDEERRKGWRSFLPSADPWCTAEPCIPVRCLSSNPFSFYPSLCWPQEGPRHWWCSSLMQQLSLGWRILLRVHSLPSGKKCLSFPIYLPLADFWENVYYSLILYMLIILIWVYPRAKMHLSKLQIYKVPILSLRFLSSMIDPYFCLLSLLFWGWI